MIPRCTEDKNIPSPVVTLDERRARRLVLRQKHTHSPLRTSRTNFLLKMQAAALLRASHVVGGTRLVSSGRRVVTSKHSSSRRSALRQTRGRRFQSAVVVVSASADPSGVKVVGVGSAGVDYLASIASFPEPDAKLRTDALEIQGGGNAGNALTAMSRLGVKPSILTKLSDDGAGKAILDEFAADGVDTSAVVIEAGKSSPFTYIIVDRAGSTRTCIHTPGKVKEEDKTQGTKTKTKNQKKRERDNNTLHTPILCVVLPYTHHIPTAPSVLAI